MNAKELILEIFREADFISETLNQRYKDEIKDPSPELRSASAIKRACGAFLNGQDPEPHTDGFQRKELELNSCGDLGQVYAATTIHYLRQRVVIRLILAKPSWF